jgi:tRNA modification GTPase
MQETNNQGMTTLETIAALSTPAGEAALHVIRLSGSKAVEIIDRCFQTRSESWHNGDANVLCLGWFCDGDKKIDQILATRMRAPASFTGEPMAEINCHGGMVVARRILDICCRQGARLAQPGEFSKRAFLNGKIDLVQAEGIIDLINAKNEMAADLALQQLGGRLSESVQGMRQEIMDLVASLEAYIDFPEEDDVDPVMEGTLREGLLKIETSLEEILRSSRTGKVIRDGIRTVIAGAPNVGKSSLLNALTQEDRAIVTDIPGTTRDEIHEYVTLGDMVLHLIDTAGLRESDDPIETLGIQRTHKAMASADVILLMLDGTRTAPGQLTDHEKQVLSEYWQKTIIIVNKTDLCEVPFYESSTPSAELNTPLAESNTPLAESNTPFAELDAYFSEFPIPFSELAIPFSVKEGRGFIELQAELNKRFFDGLDINRQPLLSNMRHIEAVQRSLESVQKALTAIELKVPFDLVSIDLTRALEEISLVTGHDVREDVIGRIFQRFCIGK